MKAFFTSSLKMLGQVELLSQTVGDHIIPCKIMTVNHSINFVDSQPLAFFHRPMNRPNGK
ncbi:hypothetical protein HZS_3476 [Henneguya salminicola]|nr:hypothetical protein HZS_3476 [Henneguya salminicola]